MRVVNLITLGFFRIWNRDFHAARNVRLDPRAFIARCGRVTLGEGTVIRAGAMLLPSRGSISIGQNSSINQYAVINGEGGVMIGNSVMIAAFVGMFAANHRFDNPAIPMREQGTTGKGIRIEDDVWIGTHATILDGVVIGKGSVIAAGSVVTKSVVPYSVVMGVPARVVRSRVPLSPNARAHA